MKKSVEKNYIYNLIYQMIAMVIPFIITPHVSRALHAEGVGIFSFTTAVTSYFILVGNLGIATYGQLQIARLRDKKREMSQVFFELIFLRGILLICIITVFTIFIQFQTNNLQIMYYILIVQIIANLIDISWFLQGLEEFKSIVLRNILIKIISVILILLLVNNKGDLYLYALIMNGSTLLGNLSIWVYLPNFIEKVPIASLNIFRHLSSCISYFIPTIATTLYLTIDKTMIGWFSASSVENGYYEQAQKIEQMAVTVVTSLTVVTMPRMAFLFRNNQIAMFKKRFDTSIQFILFLSIPMCIGLIAITDDFIPLFLGKGFEGVIPLMKIFSLLIIIVGLNNAVGKQILMPISRQKFYNVSVIIGALLNILVNLILIPKLYSLGAAIASVLAELIILILFSYFSRDFLDFTSVFKSAIKYTIASFIMFITISFINFDVVSWSLVLVKIVCGILSYFIFLLLIKDDFIFNGLRNLIFKKH